MAKLYRSQRIKPREALARKRPVPPSVETPVPPVPPGAYVIQDLTLIRTKTW